MNEERGGPGTSPPPKKGRPSLDEVMDMVSEIARDPDSGADRFRALKMLADAQGSSISTGEDLTDEQIDQKLAFFMYCAGVQRSQSAYKRAFPSARDAVTAARREKMRYKDATPEMIAKAKKITSLPLLNRLYPESVIHGIPKGFPVHQSLEKRAQWCQGEALKRMVEREIEARQGAHEALKAEEVEIRTEGTDAELHTENLPEL